MAQSIEILSAYLGRNASALLADPPFIGWSFRRTVGTDLEPPRIDYTAERQGMDFVCDQNEQVTTIFLYADERRTFSEGLQDLPLVANRSEVIARLGPPSSSGNESLDPFLGPYGPWDRFTRPGYSIHVQYHVELDVISLITLMRADAVP